MASTTVLVIRFLLILSNPRMSLTAVPSIYAFITSLSKEHQEERNCGRNDYDSCQLFCSLRRSFVAG